MLPRPVPHIDSPYSTVNASAPTPLWKGRLHLVVNHARSAGDGMIELAWRPEPWIGWSQATRKVVPAVFNADTGQLTPYGLGTKARYLRTNSTVRSSGASTNTGYLPGGIELGGGRLASVLFHLVNFPDYVGSPVESGGATWVGRVSFRARGWTIDLDWVQDYSRLKAELRADHGYALTHNARLRRTDRATFTRGQALRFLDDLHRFFGFVRGAWAGPALAVGRTASGIVVWQHWSVLRVSPATNRFSIFSGEDPDLMGRLAPGFIGKLQSEAWGNTFARAVSFYVDGNLAVPIEVGIVLAQAGLELLAWSKLVRSGRVRPAAYEKLRAGEQFRRLLQPMDVSMTTPAELAALSGTIPGLAPGADAADRIAYVRNKIVHPPRGRTARNPSRDLIVDTWRLSLHMLELALLHLGGYRGEIWSRVTEGVITVPWT